LHLRHSKMHCMHMHYSLVRRVNGLRGRAFRGLFVDSNRKIVSQSANFSTDSNRKIVSQSAIVSTNWLKNKMNDADVRILHATWDGKSKDYHESHIPASQCFNGTECRDKESKFMNMLPKAEFFEKYVGNLGINNSSHVIIYDTNSQPGFLFATRVWFMFRVFGHLKVSVLNGGFHLWKKEGNPIETIQQKVTPAVYKAKFRPELVFSFEDVEANLLKNKFQLLDARETEIFNGEKAVFGHSGHIPGALNVPIDRLISNDKTMLLPTDLRKVFESQGVDLNRRIVTNCNTGISATSLLFALYLLGIENAALYDGSWFEWTKRGGKIEKF